MRSWTGPALDPVAGSAQSLRLYDTSTQVLRQVPTGGTVGIYVCGITPYDTTHLGHAATYVTFDLIIRLLHDAGQRVHYVQNITDVDDPLFERAERDGVDWRELGTSEVEAFRRDMEALSVLPPQDYIGAIESVDEVIEMVGELLDNGSAYQLGEEDSGDGYRDVYFSFNASGHFGYESNYSRPVMDDFFAERGGDPHRQGKHSPLDALLWRAARPGEPSWHAPWGDGRPGWHIECSAIARDRLGMGFAIQGGGDDLIFPHHEFSAAHAEAASGGGRFAQLYVHAGMIGLDGVKMSKSLGNLVRVRELVREGVDPAAIRLGLFAGHYREARSWSATVLNDAEDRLRLWRAAMSADEPAPAAPAIAKVREALSFDLDTPEVLRIIDAWATSCRGPKTGKLRAETQTADGAEMAGAVRNLLGVDV